MINAVVALRISFGLILLLVAGWFGFAHRNPWVIGLLSVAFTVLYVGGKWYVWRGLWATGGIRAWAKALASTFPIQCILAALVYLIGLGLGRLFASQPFADAVAQGDFAVIVGLTVLGLIVSAVIDWLEAGKGPVHQMGAALHQRTNPASANAQTPAMSNGDDFVILPDVVAPETLFSPSRGNNDYSKKALGVHRQFDDKKPVYRSYAANDAEIAATEARIGFVLPDDLKQLYKVKNGGNVRRDLLVAKIANPRPVHEDWESAFGGYDAMNALEQLRTVHQSILDFAAEDDADAFPEGAQKMLILSQYYQQTTFLDYRAEGEPRVGIADFDREDWEEDGIWFDSFSAFFAKLVRVDSDPDRPPRTDTLTTKGPTPEHPDGFWLYGSTADHGVDAGLWTAAEQKLGVTLPAALKLFLEAANGGDPYFNILPELPGNMRQKNGLEPFPSGAFLGVDRWITLQQLSDRLEFTFGAQPWSERWINSDRLIIMSASFDTALMLDYREDDIPKIICAPSLDHPEQCPSFEMVEDFLHSLRAIRNPYINAAPIGDIRLSARACTSQHFWAHGNDAGISLDDIKAHEARLDHDLPSRLKEWMHVRDGGSVRFRYLPPLKANPNGYLNLDPTAGDWVDVFPNGILPMAQWETLTHWLQAHEEDLGEALRQRGSSQYVQDEFGDPANIIVLAQAGDHLTLLDKSRDRNVDGATIVHLAKHVAGWVETHRSVGIRAVKLTAMKADL